MNSATAERSIWATLMSPSPPDHHDRTPVDAGRRHYVARAARKAGCLGRGEMPAGVPGKGGGNAEEVELTEMNTNTNMDEMPNPNLAFECGEGEERDATPEECAALSDKNVEIISIKRWHGGEAVQYRTTDGELPHRDSRAVQAGVLSPPEEAAELRALSAAGHLRFEETQESRAARLEKARCSDCRWWQLDENDSYHAIVSPYDPATYDQIDPTEEGGEAKIAVKWGHAVRRCRCPRITFYQRPERDGATVCDGSEYKADLITGPDFGCTLFESS